MKRIRLLRVLVQPVLIIDDGETLVELDHPAVTIPAEEWETYSSERFPRELAEFEKQLNEGDTTCP